MNTNTCTCGKYFSFQIQRQIIGSRTSWWYKTWCWKNRETDCWWNGRIYKVNAMNQVILYNCNIMIYDLLIDFSSPDKTSGLIWIQSVWHSGGIPERIFEKVDFEKNQQTTTKHEKFPKGQRIDRKCNNSKHPNTSLTRCLLGNFSCFFVICCFFSKSTFSKILSKRLDPGQAPHFVKPDLCPICFQRLSADDTSRQWITHPNTSLTHCLLGNFSCFLSSAVFFQNQLFQNILSGISSECQRDWIQIRPHILSSLICVQSVSKGYQQTTLVGNE